MKFDFEKYKGQKVAMHCKTEQEAIDFCNYMYNHGKKWTSGGSYKEYTNYIHYNSETCYCFNNGTFGKRKSLIKEGFEILEWSDYMNKVFTKSDLENGDILIQQNGNVEIVIPEIGTRITKNGRFHWFSLLNEDLTNDSGREYDIVKVYRPKSPGQCSFKEEFFEKGELVFKRDAIEPIEVTLEEIAALKGVSVDRIRIKD